MGVIMSLKKLADSLFIYKLKISHNDAKKKKRNILRPLVAYQEVRLRIKFVYRFHPSQDLKNMTFIRHLTFKIANLIEVILQYSMQIFFLLKPVKIQFI